MNQPSMTASDKRAGSQLQGHVNNEERRGGGEKLPQRVSLIYPLPFRAWGAQKCPSTLGDKRILLSTVSLNIIACEIEHVANKAPHSDPM